MPRVDRKDYTFAALYGQSNPEFTSLCYLVGLVNSGTHKISDVLPAKRILSWLYDAEEQSQDAEHLKEKETFFSRYFSDGYFPQTPCMVVRSWSPISAMLDRGFTPETLNREHAKPRLAVATGIWKLRPFNSAVGIESAKTSEELFWAIMAVVSGKAMKLKMWINIIARPGWSYNAAIGSLPDWPSEEVGKAGRILWKRTPEG